MIPPISRVQKSPPPPPSRLFEATPDAEVGDPRYSILCHGMVEGDQRVLRSVSCNDRLLPGCPPNIGLWISRSASGRAGSVITALPLPSMLALSTKNRRCLCHRQCDAHGDHVSTCRSRNHLANRTRAHNRVVACLVSLLRDAGYHVNSKTVQARLPWQRCHPRGEWQCC